MLMRVVSSTWLPSCYPSTTLNTENSMKSTQRVTVFPCLSRLMTKGAYRLSICRVSLVYSNIMNPVLPSMVVSWKPQQATTKRSYVRRFSARWWIMSTRATAHLTARGTRAANSSAVILPVISSWNTLAKRSSAPTYATRTWRWAIC